MLLTDSRVENRRRGFFISSGRFNREVVFQAGFEAGDDSSWLGVVGSGFAVFLVHGRFYFAVIWLK